MNKRTTATAYGPFDEWLRQVKGRIQNTLGAMLEHSVTISQQPAAKLKPADFDALLPDGPVAITIAFGSVGGWALLLPRRLAAGLADLAALGTGDTEWNDEVHPGTLREIWGQVVADLEPDIMQIAGDEAQIGDIEVSSSADDILAGWGGEAAVVWDMVISDWGEEKLVMLVESGFAGVFKAADALEPESAPAPRVTPPRAAAPQASPPRPAPKPQPRGPVANPASFEDFEAPPPRTTEASRNIDTLLDISLPIIIELGRTRMLVRDVLDLGPGSVIELDKLSGEPVDLYVNDKRFARGEVVVIEENFGIRVTELLKVDERIKALK